MKYKFLVSLMVGMLMISPISAQADDTDLEARIAALEERVAALESQLGIATEETENGNSTKVSYSDNGHTLSFKRCEVGKDLWDKDAAILCFDYVNESDDVGSAGDIFLLKAYQHDKEIDFTSVDDSEWYTELRPGAEAIEVKFPFEIEDTTDIIVKIKSMESNIDPIEFTVSLE